MQKKWIQCKKQVEDGCQCIAEAWHVLHTLHNCCVEPELMHTLQTCSHIADIQPTTVHTRHCCLYDSALRGRLSELLQMWLGYNLRSYLKEELLGIRAPFFRLLSFVRLLVASKHCRSELYVYQCYRCTDNRPIIGIGRLIRLLTISWPSFLHCVDYRYMILK